MTRISLHSDRPAIDPRQLTSERIGRRLRDERGFSLVTIGFSFMALFAATMLAIDVGMMMTARTQAQTSADAGALAGATALVYNSFTNRTPTGPAVAGAISTAKSNKVVGGEVSVIPADVEFPFNNVTGVSDQVQVTVFRTTARENPVPTMIASFFGMDTVDVSATATAVALPADAATCVLPFTIPDKWRERSRCGGSPSCDWTVDDTYDIATTVGNRQNAGTPIANPDIYVKPGTSDATGFNPVTNKGLQLVLKTSNESKVAPSIYNVWAMPGGTGADFYRANLGGCNSHIVRMGDLLNPEPGNMVGPTQQGLNDLIAQDPNAHWDEGCNCVRGSAFPKSPRIRALPLYNPARYASGQQSGRSQPEFEVVNYLGFFVEDVRGGGEIRGRIHPIGGLVSNPNNPPIGAFAQAIMLVK